VVHPSPVDTAFYAGNTHEIGAMKMFQKTATAPTTIANCFFISMGKSLVHDQGTYTSLLSLFFLEVICCCVLCVVLCVCVCVSVYVYLCMCVCVL